MKQYRLSPEAKQDLDDIFDYVAREAGIATAERLIDDITDRLPFLASNPAAGRQREELEAGARSFPVGSYIVYYRRSPIGIDIARILHGKRDQATSFPAD